MKSHYPKLIEGYQGGGFSIYAAVRCPHNNILSAKCYCQKAYNLPAFKTPVYMNMSDCEICGYH